MAHKVNSVLARGERSSVEKPKVLLARGERSSLAAQSKGFVVDFKKVPREQHSR
jgi:hypothetical protein